MSRKARSDCSAPALSLASKPGYGGRGGSLVGGGQGMGQGRGWSPGPGCNPESATDLLCDLCKTLSSLGLGLTISKVTVLCSDL